MNDPIECLEDTGGDEIHHPYTAWNQGYDAFLASHHFDANPYPVDKPMPTRHNAWADGWMWAQGEETRNG